MAITEALPFARARKKKAAARQAMPGSVFMEKIKHVVGVIVPPIITIGLLLLVWQILCSAQGSALPPPRLRSLPPPPCTTWEW